MKACWHEGGGGVTLPEAMFGWIDSSQDVQLDARTAALQSYHFIKMWF